MGTQCGGEIRNSQNPTASEIGLGLANILEWVTILMKPLSACSEIPYRDSPLTTLDNQLLQSAWSLESDLNA